MWRMWDEGVWFVAITVLVAIAWIVCDRLTGKRGNQSSRWPSALATAVAVALWFIRYEVVLYQQRHWEPLRRLDDGEWVVSSWVAGPELQELMPDAGVFLTIALGALFGIAFGTAITSLLRRRISFQRLWMGALALLVVSIAYSLPVYHREISDLLRASGLQSLKVSVADITLEAALATKGSQGVASASGGATGSPAQSVPRFTDPTPGLQAFKYDFLGKSKDHDDRMTSRDLHDYVRFVHEGEKPGISQY